ncbi:glycosyltransferase family 4 protein [Longibacter sp.]|uniref:glycosyltransferase family 4 protein n=1 Tax=Longibacter sp. TaxID=2045415 RepID=UPI003EB833CE
MKIGHYTYQPGARGGIASYVRRLGNAQADIGHDVEYLCRNGEGSDLPSVREVNGDVDLFETAQQRRLDVLHLHRRIRHLPEHRVPTVRTMHGNQGSCPSGSRFLKRSGRPCNRDYSVSGCLWGHLIDHCGSRRPGNVVNNFRRIETEHELAAKIPTATVSRFVKERMIRSGCMPDHLKVIHSPAPDLNRPPAPLQHKDPPRMLFAGRIEPKKGVEWLLRSLPKTDVPVFLDVAGTGDIAYMQKVKALVEDLGLTGRITFHGWVEEADVYRLIEQARAVVVPSLWHEPAGLVTLEAAAVGRPVIASQVGGISEYARDPFALQVSPGDVDELAECIDRLALDPERAASMGQQARAIARDRFSMDDFVSNIMDLYRSTVTTANGLMRR